MKNLARVSFLVFVTWRIIISLTPFYILVNGVYQSYSSTESLMLEHQFLHHEREIGVLMVWVAGFSKRIGYTSCFAAELWGLREGLLLCYNLNIQLLEIEVDAKSIVDVLGNLSYVNNIISPILDDYRQLITRFQQVRIMHCFRQANRCADGLARMSFRMLDDFKVYNSPPVDVLDVFEGDLIGMYLNRICPEPCVFP